MAARSAPAVSALPLVVGITTLPSRIDLLRPTLDSLGAQTRMPDRVLLCLPRWSHREARAYERPGWLATYSPLLDIVECEDDWGPGTKLLGCLDELSEPTCLVIADDDMHYRPGFLEGLYDAQTRDTASSFSYWTYASGPFTVGQGADGFSFYSPSLAGIREFARRALQCPSLRLVDDLWISAFLKRSGIAVKSLRHLIPDGGTIYVAAHAVNQLCRLPGAPRGASMRAGIAFLLESGLMGRRARAGARVKRLLSSARDSALGR